MCGACVAVLSVRVMACDFLSLYLAKDTFKNGFPKRQILKGARFLLFYYKLNYKKHIKGHIIIKGRV